MIWNYITVLGLGILLGWRISRLFGQISQTAAKDTPSASSAPSGTSEPNTPANVTASTPMSELTESEPTETEPAEPKPLEPKPAALPVSSSTTPDASVVASDELRLAYEMAHHLGQYKAGFLARTSHELRSPLNRVMSLQQLVLADLCDNPAEERDFIRQSYEAAQELLELLDQTTTISKLAHGTVPLATETLSLESILAELEMQTGLHAKNRNLRLSIQQPDADIPLLADPRWLRQVLINLVTTPIYLMDQGHIDVTYEVDTNARTLSFQITDERPATSWTEPIDLLVQSDSTDAQPSTTLPTSKQALQELQTTGAWGLNLITTTKLVDVMNGQLEILATPSSDQEKTVIQCTIPLA